MNSAYSRLDDIKHACIKCGKELNTLFERCSCGYSRVDDFKYYCAQCRNELNTPFERCSCGRADSISS